MFNENQQDLPASYHGNEQMYVKSESLQEDMKFIYILSTVTSKNRSYLSLQNFLLYLTPEHLSFLKFK